MMSFGVLLLCAVTGLMLGSTIKPAQEMNTEDAVSKQMEERLLSLVRVETAAVKEDILDVLSRKLEQVSNTMSDVGKLLERATQNMTEKLEIQKLNLLLTHEPLWSEVRELRDKDMETFKKIENVENEVSLMRADLLQVQLNETANMTQSCLESQAHVQETTQNIERLDNGQSNLSFKIGNVAISLEELRRDLDDVKVIMQSDIGQLKKELSRIQIMCSPPCENGGQCMTNNTCQCTISFAGDRCQQAVCSPPCENGGECMKNNFCSCPSSFTGDRCEEPACIPPCENGGQCMENKVCNCTPLFTGDRCQDGGPKCGVDFNNGGGNDSSALVWPWMAAVYLTGYGHICGGSVIHRHFVLTSARCMHVYRNARLSVKLGLSDLKNGTHLQEHRVQSTHIHPQFKTGTGLYDINLDYNIVLLELEDPIPFGPFVRPICLPPREIPQDDTMYKPQSTAKAVSLEEYLSYPLTASPTVINLTVLPQEECIRKNKESGWVRSFPSPDLFFCTESSPRTCPEWGSPLMESRVEGGGTRTWTQVGIQSKSSDCQYEFSPRLDHLRAWVDATIAASSKA